MNIAVVGAGYVGVVVSASLAKTGHRVTVLDTDKEKVKILQTRRAPFYEPGLDELLKSLPELSILFTTLPIKDQPKQDLWVVCVGTPPTGDGSLNMMAVHKVVAEIANCTTGATVAIKSTVMPGTCRQLAERFDFDGMKIVYWPEFLRQGTAVEDIYRGPGIFGTSDGTGKDATPAMCSMHGRRETCQVLCNRYEDVELTKLALNGFLATRVSYINVIAGICETVGADITVVQKLLASDPRVGALFAGPGWGGSCLPKDLAALSWLDRLHGGTVLEGTEYDNSQTQEVLLHRIRPREHLAIWGCAFKSGTSDLRNSFVHEIIAKHLGKVKITVYDESLRALDDMVVMYGNHIGWYVVKGDAAVGADTLVVHHESQPVDAIALDSLKSLMAPNPTLVDCRNLYDPKTVEQAGFTYVGIGRRK